MVCTHISRIRQPFFVVSTIAAGIYNLDVCVYLLIKKSFLFYFSFGLVISQVTNFVRFYNFSLIKES